MKSLRQPFLAAAVIAAAMMEKAAAHDIGDGGNHIHGEAAFFSLSPAWLDLAGPAAAILTVAGIAVWMFRRVSSSGK